MPFPNPAFLKTLIDMNRTQPLPIIESHCILGGKVDVSNFASKLFWRYRDGG